MMNKLSNSETTQASRKMTKPTIHFALSKPAIPEPTLLTGDHSYIKVTCRRPQAPPTSKRYLVTTDPTKVTCKKCLRSLK
jgi:hypothetical protein